MQPSLFCFLLHYILTFPVLRFLSFLLYPPAFVQFIRGGNSSVGVPRSFRAFAVESSELGSICSEVQSGGGRIRPSEPGFLSKIVCCCQPGPRVSLLLISTVRISPSRNNINISGFFVLRGNGKVFLGI